MHNSYNVISITREPLPKSEKLIKRKYSEFKILNGHDPKFSLLKYISGREPENCKCFGCHPELVKGFID